MKKLILAGAMCAILAVPSASLGAPRDEPGVRPFIMAGTVALSVRDCLNEARFTGRDAFAVKYGNLRNCVRLKVDAYTASVESAVQTCASERDSLGASAFSLTYGAPFPFLSCVRSKLAAPPPPPDPIPV